MKGQSKQLVRNTFRNFKWNFKDVVFFEVVYKILALLIVVPLNYAILDRSILETGVSSVTNKELVAFGLTLPGIVGIGLILIISFVAIFVEMAILTYMANESYKHRDATLLEGVVNCLRIIPRKPSIYMVFVVLLSGVLGPLTGVGIYNSLIKELSVPSFIQVELFKSFGGKVLFVVVMGILFVIVLRWLLSIPVMIIEQVSLKEAFAKGRQIYKTSRFKIIYYIVWWGIVNFVLKLVLLVGYVAIGSGIIYVLGGHTLLAKVFIGIYLLLFLGGYTILSVITLPLFIAFLVELYYGYRDYEGKARSFEMIDEYTQNKVYQWLGEYKRTFQSVIWTLFGVMVVVMALSAIKGNVIDKKIDVTAHRGSSLKAPENSLAALKVAMAEGADYVEIDAMSTRDGRVVLFHDATLKRIDGTNRKIHEMTLEEAQQVDNGSHFSAEFSQERIPSLEQVFELCKGKVKLNIELKPYGNEDKLPEYVAQLVEDYDMTQEVVVSSLEYSAIQQFRKHQPLVRVGYIMSFGFGDFTKLDVDFISVEYDLLSKELIYGMNALGKEVHVWTINEKERVMDVARLRVDNIITDSVESVQETLKQLEKRDIDPLTWFVDSVTAILRYVVI